MCQYNPRCPTGRHRPGTVCSYAGWRGSTVRIRSQPNTIHTPSSARPRLTWSHHQGAALVTAGVSFADTLVWWIWLAVIWDPRLYRVTIIATLIAVGLPAGLAAYWLSRCSGWLNDGSRRCRQPRIGFLRRCAHHSEQVITWYDFAGAVAAVLAAVNLAALFVFG